VSWRSSAATLRLRHRRRSTAWQGGVCRRRLACQDQAAHRRRRSSRDAVSLLHQGTYQGSAAGRRDTAGVDGGHLGGGGNPGGRCLRSLSPDAGYAESLNRAGTSLHLPVLALRRPTPTAASKSCARPIRLASAQAGGSLVGNDCSEATSTGYQVPPSWSKSRCVYALGIRPLR